MTIEVNEALEAIKAQVETKFEGVAVKADLEALTETKADVAAVAELKGVVEALEAKFDAMPAPALIKATQEEIKSMKALLEEQKRRLKDMSGSKSHRLDGASVFSQQQSGD